ncbi:MAG: hypothetical protein K6U11_06345 [bacterium]|nr:hypothetical protein [bacterium]
MRQPATAPAPAACQPYLGGCHSHLVAPVVCLPLHRGVGAMVRGCFTRGLIAHNQPSPIGGDVVGCGQLDSLFFITLPHRVAVGKHPLIPLFTWSASFR